LSLIHARQSELEGETRDEDSQVEPLLREAAPRAKRTSIMVEGEDEVLEVEATGFSGFCVSIHAIFRSLTFTLLLFNLIPLGVFLAAWENIFYAPELSKVNYDVDETDSDGLLIIHETLQWLLFGISSLVFCTIAVDVAVHWRHLLHRAWLYGIELTLFVIPFTFHELFYFTDFGPSRALQISNVVYITSLYVGLAARVIRLHGVSLGGVETSVEDPHKLQNVHCTWVVRDIDGMARCILDDFARLQAQASQFFKIKVFQTGKKTEGETDCPFPTQSGRPDWHTELLTIAQRALNKQPDASARRPVVIGLFFCGSLAMARAVNNTAVAVSFQLGNRVRFTFNKENF